MLQIRCRRLQPLAGVSASRRPQRKRVNLAAAVEDEPEPIDIPEIKEVIDASLKGVDKAIYGALKDHGPKMLPFTRTFITISIVCTLIIGVSQALAFAARLIASKITQQENPDDEVTTYSTTASLLQPLVVTLPIIGVLVALQRGFVGLTTLFEVCTKSPAWFQNPIADALHWFVHWAAPLQCHLANATGVVVLLSLTWTLLILKRRVFNRVVTKLTIDAHGTKEESVAADLNRSLLPLNTLISWFLIGASILFGLKLVGLDPAPLLAVGGVSGIVVGFASQSLLLNLIAGISIFITRPFVVGDIVQMKNNHLLIGQGTITNISPLRTTYLDDNSESVTLPNKLITDLIITNLGRESARRDMTRSMDSQQPQVKQILTHEITLQRPENDSIEYDDYARRVAKGLRQHLSSLPNTLQNSMKVFVSGLSSSGDIQITIVGVGLRTPNMPAETIREDFYLAIHKALCVLKRESAADVQHEIEEQDAEAKALATEEMERVAMSGNKSGPGPMIA